FEIIKFLVKFDFLVPFLEPRIVDYLVDRDPSFRIDIQKTREKSFEVRRCPFRATKLSFRISGATYAGVPHSEAVVSDLILNRTESEVGDFEVPILVQKQVFRLQISVENASRVAIFAETTFSYLCKELSALGEFHDERDDIGMTQEMEDGDLPFYVAGETTFDDLLFADDFNGDALSGLDISRVINLGESAAP
ncbi:LOW QUALITY PROTEIN: hypothetical protein RJ641_028633, partial [Dillenia turbinata]